MKRSILFVINTLGIGGAERALISLISALPEDGFDIDLLVVTSQGELVKEVPEYVHFISDCAPVSVLSGEGRKRLKKLCIRSFFKNGRGFVLFPYMLDNLFSMLRTKRIRPDKLLWRLLSDSAPVPEKRYDLAVAYIEGGATYYVADHVNAVRKVAFVHTPYSMAGYTPKLDRGCYRAFNRIYAVSQPAAEDLIKVYPKLRSRVGVFENLIDLGRIRRMSQQSGFSDGYEGHRIVSLMRLTPEKSIDISIKAMSVIRSQRKDVRWYVFGDGDEKERLRQLISDKGLESDFILCGTVSNPYPYIRESDVYVQASRYEGRSIAIREAMALGSPVIVSDVPGNREHIKNGYNGLLCSLDPVDIAEKILSLLSDKLLADELGSNAALSENEDIDPVKLLFE